MRKKSIINLRIPDGMNIYTRQKSEALVVGTGLLKGEIVITSTVKHFQDA